MSCQFLITWSRLLIHILILNDKQCRSKSVGFFRSQLIETVQIQISWLLQKPTDWRSQLIWSYTVCKDRIHPGSAGQGLTFTTLRANSADNKLMIFFLFFPENRMTFHANYLHWRQFAWNVKFRFLGKRRKIFQYIVCWKFYPKPVLLMQIKATQSNKVLY